MLDMMVYGFGSSSASSQSRRATLTWLLWFLGLMGAAGLYGLLIMRQGPQLALLVWLIYLLGAAAIIYRPRYGIYFIVFMSLSGDQVLAPAYPLIKNLSSRESLLYVHDALIINPVEIYMLLTAISWLGRGAMQRKLHFFRGPLFWPALLFLVFAVFGLVYGLRTGGDMNIALWEIRPLFYLFAMIILSSNLLEKREHVGNVLWFAMAALFIEGLIGTRFFFLEFGGRFDIDADLTEHTAAVHMNTFFVFVLAAWLFRGSYRKRLLLPLMVPPVIVIYIATQRRGAFLALGIALVLMAIFLYRENRTAFWLIVPPLTVLGLFYILAFWNGGGALGGPVQAFKSIIAPEQVSAVDQSSNLYRELENANISYTIHQRPFTGVGFGQKFFVVYPMPDISFFEWWQYFPHNSIMWIWLKMGAGGFLSMLVLVGLAIMLSVRVVLRVPGGDLRAVGLTLALYLVMHFAFAYSDISWDAPSMIYVGLAMGVANSLERIASRPVPLPQKRWPWQPDPQPAPDLVPALNDFITYK